MWNNVREADPSDSWAELAENGWGALMGWAAGKENLRCHLSSDEGRTVTGSIERRGVKQFFEEPFTAADRQDVDDDIDGFLKDAGLPPRPRGYVWMIRVPGAYASPEAFIEAVDLEILKAARGLVYPADLRPVFETVLPTFYEKA
jgi:hypothetical protein